MTISELQKVIENYLKQENASENDEVIFFVRDYIYLIQYHINDYGFAKDHLQLQYISQKI